MQRKTQNLVMDKHFMGFSRETRASIQLAPEFAPQFAPEFTPEFTPELLCKKL